MAKYNKITDKVREKLWVVWQEKQSDLYVAGKCQVSKNTVKKYRLRDKWQERFDRIVAAAHKKVDKQTVEHRVRHAKLGQVLQKVGADCFVDEATGKVKKGVVRKAADAIRAIESGVGIEVQALGEDTSNIEEEIRIIYTSVKYKKKGD